MDGSRRAGDAWTWVFGSSLSSAEMRASWGRTEFVPGVKTGPRGYLYGISRPTGLSIATRLCCNNAAKEAHAYLSMPTHRDRILIAGQGNSRKYAVVARREFGVTNYWCF